MALKLPIEGKSAIEIGGPSYLFRDIGIYNGIASLDNVVFSISTIWDKFKGNTFEYAPGKTGKILEMDGVDLSAIKSDSYDILLSSHNLEHIANPLKALLEWIRVIKPGGHIILILPNKEHCFDHQRPYTSFDTIVDKYQRQVGEDNLESLPEILKLHDLKLDPAAGNFEQFTHRSLNNYANRCLHHVFDHELVVRMCEFGGIDLVHHHINGLNMWFVLKC